MRPVTAVDRQLAWLWLAAAVSTVALRPLWLLLAPHLRPCTFRSIFGVACPSCGTTRAAVAFFDADVPAALAANPLAAVAALLFVFGAPVAVAWTSSGRPVPQPERILPRWQRTALVAVVIVNWLYVIVIS